MEEVMNCGADKEIILSGTVGSQLYRTASGGSDIDVMEVVLLPLKEYLCNTSGTRSWSSASRGVDTTQYEASFFIRLCVNANLNVLPLLWSDIGVDCSMLGRELIYARDGFITKQLAVAGVGFCMSNLSDVERDDRATGKLGAARKALIQQYGYDTKAAMHAVRIARMIYETISQPERGLTVVRSDADELLAIRSGLRSRRDVCNEARSLIKQIDLAASKSRLPDKYPLEFRDNLIMHIVGKYVRNT